MAGKPVTRTQLKRELVVNAATKPLNISVGASVAVAAILTGAPWLLGVAAVVYLALAALTLFDEDEAARVGDRVYQRDDKPREALEAKALMPPIRAQLEAARGEQRAIARTIEGSDLTWADVRSESGQLVAALEAAARRAQKLSAYLADQDPYGLERRIQECERSGQHQTAEALRTQLAELRRLNGMLHNTFGEMEQVNASLKTVHARLVGAAVSTEAGADADLAGDVRELRARVETLTAGLADVRT